MELVHISDPKPKPKLAFPKVLLKDYLRDDLSSCSSSGFRSLPRQTPPPPRRSSTVQSYLLQNYLKDSNANPHKTHKQKLLRSRSATAAVAAAESTISALQRASVALINAIKNLHFASSKPPPSLLSNAASAKKGILPRSLSRRPHKRRAFWKICRKPQPKAVKIEHWKTFRDLLTEEQKSSKNYRNNNNRHAAITVPSTTASSSSRTSKCNGSWDSEFTAEFLPSSSCDSEFDGEKCCSEGENFLREEKVSPDSAGENLTNATSSPPKNATNWSQDADREQFSPVSTLDFPFDDEEICFHRQHSRNRGTKSRQRTICFENLKIEEPLDLDLAISAKLDFEEATNEPPCSEKMYSIEPFIYEAKGKAYDVKENFVRQKAQELLMLVTIPLYNTSCTVANLLLDFFEEMISSLDDSMAKCGAFQQFEFWCELIGRAEEWVKGQQKDLYKEGRELESMGKACVREMERGRTWNEFEKEDRVVALEVEGGVFASLMDELLLDLGLA